MGLNGKGFDANWAKKQGRQDDEACLDTLIRQGYSTGLFGQAKNMRDFLVDDTWVGPGVHEKIELSQIANGSFNDDQIAPMQLEGNLGWPL